ncbi:histidine phosphatase family protein [Deinococcus sp. Leaf326]|uniref:histidine phosphatase family protein n=1 Tax=Deinococcus sp. Leaf326 TaxID=1736338 RepID=UPI0006F74F19|nr:histidine phosphatase family protein [Deinococcus sp. Leaf326]KQR40934.1 hypothetical protein ASF71_01990 [Deinococcus sp. Leaf326]
MSLPPGTLLLVRHAQATGQAPDAALTPAGETAAQGLADRLAGSGLTGIVSSPWTRAVSTARPAAHKLGLDLRTDPRLTERVLSRRDLPYWRAVLRLSFLWPGLRWPGGESGRTARARILDALADARDPSGAVAVVSHGNLLALALGLDYGGWAALRSPDVWVLPPDGRPPFRLDP